MITLVAMAVESWWWVQVKALRIFFGGSGPWRQTIKGAVSLGLLANVFTGVEKLVKVELNISWRAQFWLTSGLADCLFAVRSGLGGVNAAGFSRFLNLPGPNNG